MDVTCWCLKEGNSRFSLCGECIYFVLGLVFTLESKVQGKDRRRQMMTSAERAGGVSGHPGTLLCVLGHF